MKTPYKYRGVLLLTLLILVLPWMAWCYALSGTFSAWRDCRRLSAQLAAMPLSEQAELSIPVSGQELILSGGALDALHRIAAECSARITGYEPLITQRQDGIALHTAQIMLTGGYRESLRALAKIEKELPQCRLRSLAWRAAADRNSRRTQLTLTLYIQQIVINRP